jgi:hypothetical protein
MIAPALPAYTNWNWITSRLAVGGEPPHAAYAALQAYGFEAVIDLRDLVEVEGVAPSPVVARLHLPTPDGQAPPPGDFDRALTFIAAHGAREARILIHCVHGIGRSAIVAFAALVAGGLDPMEALTLSKNRRWRIAPSCAQYEAWADWLMQHRKAAARDFVIPDFEAFARIVYRHLAKA